MNEQLMGIVVLFIMILIVLGATSCVTEPPRQFDRVDDPGYCYAVYGYRPGYCQ